MLATTFKTLSEFVSFLAQSFKLAAIVPAFVFLISNQLFVIPRLPLTPPMAKFMNLELQNQLTVVIFLALILGYILTLINIPLIQLFEGYPWYYTWCGKRLRDLHSKRRKQLLKLSKDETQDAKVEQIKKLSQEVRSLGARNPRRDVLDKEIKELSAQITQSTTSIEKLIIKQYISDYYPPNDSLILPTSFGNLIAAFEHYPARRYGINSVTIWPRFVPILSDTNINFTTFIEREKAGLDFAINFSFLLALLSLEILYSSLLYQKLIVDSLLLIITILLTAIIFYQIAIVCAGNWGMTVKVAFDLHRYSLLHELNMKIPDDPLQEFHTWEAMSDFYRDDNDENREKFLALISYDNLAIRIKQHKGDK